MQIMVRDAYAFGDDGEEEYDGPSKSEVKRQLLALQDLGKQLTAMPQETLSKLSLPDDVLREVQEFQRIKTFKAKQRQIQHIGKLLRNADADAIRKAIADVKGQSAGMVALQHRCEKLRDELIASDEPLTAFVSSHPDVDLQSLRQTIRMARREAAKERARIASLRKPVQKKIDAAEKRMAEIDARAAELDAQIADPAFYSGEAQVEETLKERSALTEEKETLEAEWLELSEELESIK